MSNLSISKPYSKQLILSGKIWLAIAFFGQLLFAIYIILLYWMNGIIGNLDKWNINTPQGYVAEDPMGNLAFGLHVLLAGIITIGGPLQLLPVIRSRFPKFHRINGRVYIAAAFLISFAGLYLSWVRGSVGGLVGSIFITINAIIIMIAAFYTIKYAIARELDIHSRWALRLFLAMSGVYFFRIVFMFWMGINKGEAIGVDLDAFTGPVLNVIYTLTYIMPLVFLEMFFAIRTSGSRLNSIIMTIFLGALSLAWVFGIIVTTMGMWLPAI